MLRQEQTKGFFAFRAGLFEFRTEFNLAEEGLGLLILRRKPFAWVLLPIPAPAAAQFKRITAK